MAKISGIYVEIRGDSTQLRKDLATARQHVTEQATGMSNALNNALSPAQLKNNINGIVRNLNTLSQASKLTGKEFGAIGADLKDLQRLTGISEKAFRDLQSRMLQTSAAKAQETALRNIAKAANLSAKEVSQLGKQMGVSASSIAAVNGAAKSSASAMTMLGSAAKASLAYFSVQTVVEFGRAIMDAGLAMDSLQRSFVAVTGSQAGAAETLSFLRKESDRLGQNFYTLAPEFKNVMAAARGTAMEGENVRKMFSAIAGASTALGLSADDTHGTLRALQQMMSKGTIQAEELRGQLGERLPGALNLMAKAMGVSTAELNKMMADGKLLADDALPKLTIAIEEMYGAAAEKAALESGRAAVNRLSQAWEEFKINLFDNQAFVFAANSIRLLVTAASKAVGEWTIKEQLVAAQNELKGLEQIDGTPMATLPGFQSRLEATRKEVARLKDELLQLEKPATDAFLAMTKGLEQAENRAGDYISYLQDADQKLEKLLQTDRDKIDATYRELSGKVKDQAALDKWYADEVAKLNEKSTKKFADEQNKQLEAHKKAREAMRKNEAETLSAIDKWMDDYEQRQIDAVANGVAERKKLREEEAKAAADAARKIAEEQEASAQKVMDRIQEGTADVFYDMFQDIGKGWETLWASMKNWALRTLAELAARAATVNIVVPIMTSMTGTQDAAGAVQALTGGQSGMGNMPTSGLSNLIPESWKSGLSGVTNWTLPGTAGMYGAYTGAYSAVGAAPSMYATGMGFTSGQVANGALQGMSLGGTPLAASAAPMASGGMTLGTALGYGGWGGLGYSLLGSQIGLPQSQYSGLTASAGGMLGAWGASALASAAGGAAAGAAAGSVVPVIGTVIGAIIGGLAGSMIGGETVHSPSVIFQEQIKKWGETTGTQYHLKSGGKEEIAKQITEQLDAIFETSYATVDALLSGLGDGYAEQLKDATVTWGRKAGGLWKEWDFGADMDMSQLLNMAAADIQHATFEAAAGALTKVGQDLAAKTEVADLLGDLSEKPAVQFQKLIDVVAKGAEEGKAEEYANHLMQLHNTLNTMTAVWDDINQQIEDLINPPSDYELKVRSTNKQFDEWVVTLKNLGFAEEKISEIEEKRQIVLDGLTKSLADLTKAEQDMVNARKDELAARRAKEDAEQKAYQERLDAYEKSGEDFQKLADALLKAGDAAGLLKANIARAFANPKGTYTAGGYEYELPHGMPTTAEEYLATKRLIRENSEQWAAQKRAYEYQLDLMYATMAKDVNANVSANMLRIMNAGFVDPGVSKLAKYYIDHAMEGLSSDLRGLVGSAVSASVTTSTWSQFMPAGPGLAEIGRVNQEIANTKNEMLAVENSMFDLNRTLKQGIIDADTYARGIEAVSNALPDAYSAYQELQSMTYEERLVAQEKQAAAEMEMLVNAGIRSANYYFSDLNKMIKELGEAAQAANTELVKLESTMGYLKSFADAFGFSARAASGGAYQYGIKEMYERAQAYQKEIMDRMESFYGKDSEYYAKAKSGYDYNAAFIAPQVQASLDAIPLIESKEGRNAAIVAEAAKKAMSVLTTRSAAAMAEELKKLPAFADLLPESLRDMSLLMDGIAQYDAEGFLNAFYRISDALNTGTINAEQFAQMFDLSLDVFENGIKDAAKKMSAQDLADLWEKILQASMDLVSPPTDYEMQVRQTNEQYKEWIDTLKEAGAEQEKLTLLEEHRVTVLENLAKKQAELIEKELASINRDISHLLDPLSEYEQQLYSLNEQFDAWAETLKELGATTEQLISIESQRAVVLENLRLTTDVATAEEALRASFAKESETLNKIITDHANLLAEKGAALKTAYSEELSRLDKIIADHDQAVSTAKSDLQRAYQKEQSELQQTSDRFKMLAKQLEDWRTAFWSGTDSPLDFEQRTEMLYGNFRMALEKALSGDEDAFGKLAGDASSYLQAAKENASTREDYARIAGGIAAQMKEAEKAAEGQKSVADKQLEALELQAKGVEGLVEASLSFADAFDAYNRAVADSAAADAEKQKKLVEEQMKQTGLIDEVLDWTSALNAFLDVQASREAEEAQAQLDALTTQVNALLKIDESVLSIGEAINNLARAQQALAAAQAARAAADLAAAQAAATAAKETSVKGYASGGYHTGGLRIVGERGPELESTGASRIWSADETRDILMGGSNNGVVIEIQKLREDMAAANYAIAKNTAATANMLGRWDGDGMPEERAM